MTNPTQRARRQDATTGFAARLRRATMADHRDAENRTFMSRLLAGHVPIAGVAQLTAQYLVVYRELEAAADSMRADEVAGGFADPALSRLSALEADLARLYGPNRTSTPTVLPSTERYAHRLREHCRTSPVHFIAHHYVRYLGDLSGGQFVGQALLERYGLDAARTSFYRFDHITDLRAYRTAYRQRLDALAYPEDDLVILLAEARLAFRLNAAIFDELDKQYPDDQATVA